MHNLGDSCLYKAFKKIKEQKIDASSFSALLRAEFIIEALLSGVYTINMSNALRVLFLLFIYFFLSGKFSLSGINFYPLSTLSQRTQISSIIIHNMMH